MFVVQVCHVEYLRGGQLSSVITCYGRRNKGYLVGKLAPLQTPFYISKRYSYTDSSRDVTGNHIFGVIEVCGKKPHQLQLPQK